MVMVVGRLAQRSRLQTDLRSECRSQAQVLALRRCLRATVKLLLLHSRLRQHQSVIFSHQTTTEPNLHMWLEGKVDHIKI